MQYLAPFWIQMQRLEDSAPPWEHKQQHQSGVAHEALRNNIPKEKKKYEHIRKTKPERKLIESARERVQNPLPNPINRKTLHYYTVLAIVSSDVPSDKPACASRDRQAENPHIPECGGWAQCTQLAQKLRTTTRLLTSHSSWPILHLYSFPSSLTLLVRFCASLDLSSNLWPHGVALH